jgi:hypothetical protein
MTVNETGSLCKLKTKIHVQLTGLNLCELYGENSYYNLYAIVCHIGDNYQVGHYTAFCRDGECSFNYDDDVVNEVRMDVDTLDYDTCTTNGYLLFYVGQDSEPNIMNLQPQSKFLKLDEEGNSASASFQKSFQILQ